MLTLADDGIYVTDDGAVACYDQVGSSYPVPYVS